MSSTTDFIAQHVSDVIAFTRNPASLDLIHVAHGTGDRELQMTTLSDLEGDPAGAHVFTRTFRTPSRIRAPHAWRSIVERELDTEAGR